MNELEKMQVLKDALQTMNDVLKTLVKLTGTGTQEAIPEASVEAEKAAAEKAAKPVDIKAIANRVADISGYCPRAVYTILLTAIKVVLEMYPEDENDASDEKQG